MFYIGIDLAWTYRNETGICIFDDQKCVHLSAEVYSDDEIVDLVRNYHPSVVSIDAPLVVNIETGGRSVDSTVMKTKINGRHLKLYATSRSYMLRTFKAIRGEDLLALLSERGYTLGKNIYETYPTGIYLSLFPEIFDHRYKISSRLPLKDLKLNSQRLLNEITRMGFDLDLYNDDIKTKKTYKNFEDKLDAVMCALNSYYQDHDSGLVFWDDSGMIALPKKK